MNTIGLQHLDNEVNNSKSSKLTRDKLGIHLQLIGMIMSPYIKMILEASIL